MHAADHAADHQGRRHEVRQDRGRRGLAGRRDDRRRTPSTSSGSTPRTPIVVTLPARSSPSAPARRSTRWRQSVARAAAPREAQRTLAARRHHAGARRRGRRSGRGGQRRRCSAGATRELAELDAGDAAATPRPSCRRRRGQVGRPVRRPAGGDRPGRRRATPPGGRSPRAAPTVNNVKVDRPRTRSSPPSDLLHGRCRAAPARARRSLAAVDRRTAVLRHATAERASRPI